MAADPLTAGTVDELLNYDVSDDDIFNDNPISKSRDDKATLSPRGIKRKIQDEEKENFGLGLDEEVKIAKKRQPIVKLDEAKLLSQPGIPKLRELTRNGNLRKKLKLKGKGHEFADVARLLNYYQLWLDNLYPRAKFADGLQLVEKVGHSKRMQVMRKEWIDEGKPGYIRDRALQKSIEQEHGDLNGETNQAIVADIESENTNASALERPHSSIFVHGTDTNSIFFPDSNEAGNQRNDHEPDEDELDALLFEHTTTTAKPTKMTNNVDSEGEDDLDALLAEAETRKQQRVAPSIPNDGDDLDALLAERDVIAQPKTTKQRPTIFDDDDDEEDAEAEDQTQKSNPSLPALNIPPPGQQQVQEESQEDGGKMFTSSPLLNDVDELDAILAEHDAQREAELSSTPKGVSSLESPRKETIDGDHETQESSFQIQHAILSSSPLPNDDLD